MNRAQRRARDREITRLLALQDRIADAAGLAIGICNMTVTADGGGRCNRCEPDAAPLREFCRNPETAPFSLPLWEKLATGPAWQWGPTP